MPASRRKHSRKHRSPRTRSRQKNAKNKAAAEHAAVQTFLQEQNLLHELQFNSDYAHTYRMGEQYGVRAAQVRHGGVELAWRNYCQIASSADQTENAKLVFSHAFERGFDSGTYERQCDSDGEY